MTVAESLQEAAPVKLRPLEERDVPRVTQMLVDYLHQEADPIKDIRGLSNTDTYEYFHTMASHPENRAFSVVAVVGGSSEAGRSEGEAEEIVSFLLALPFETMQNLEQAYHPKGDWRVDDAVWTGLFEEFKRDPPCSLDKVLSFCGMATIPAFRGRGLAVQLHLDSIAAAERSGLQYVVADVWTAASKSVVDKLGMKPYKGVRNAFRNVTLEDGTQPLAHRADVPEFIILAGKSLPWAME